MGKRSTKKVRLTSPVDPGRQDDTAEGAQQAGGRMEKEAQKQQPVQDTHFSRPVRKHDTTEATKKDRMDTGERMDINRERSASGTGNTGRTSLGRGMARKPAEPGMAERFKDPRLVQSVSDFRKIMNHFAESGQTNVSYSRLEPSNYEYNVDEGIQAKIKDPLWLLGRQWQMGEFKATDGGEPAKVDIDYSELPLDSISNKNGEVVETMSDPSKVPLEMKVEKENGEDSAPLWIKERLEYAFGMRSDTGHEMISPEYDGDYLDWYGFDMKSFGTNGDTKHATVIPSHLDYFGMPSSRWWEIEDDTVNLGSFIPNQLNYLIAMLTEFAYISSNDWFIAPLEQKVGTVRRIEKVRMTDTFGETEKLSEPPVDRSGHDLDFELFTHRNVFGSVSQGKVFFYPNALKDALEGKPIEKVSFLRDEMANLVWALEDSYQDKGSGEIKKRSEEEKLQEDLGKPSFDPELYWDTVEDVVKEKKDIIADEGTSEVPIGARYIGPLDRYLPKTYVPPYWIPYVPRRIKGTGGQIKLRRGRTRPISGTSPGAQYKGRILEESKYVFEEEVPRTGIKVERLPQLAVIEDPDTLERKVFKWIGRRKLPDRHREESGLAFDQLIKPK